MWDAVTLQREEDARRGDGGDDGGDNGGGGERKTLGAPGRVQTGRLLSKYWLEEQVK